MKLRLGLCGGYAISCRTLCSSDYKDRFHGLLAMLNNYFIIDENLNI